MEAILTLDPDNARTGTGPMPQDFANNFSPADVTVTLCRAAMPIGCGAEDRDLRAADAESLIAPDDGND